MSETLTPLSDSLGVMVSGLTSADLVTEQAAARCADLLERHGVVVYRGVDVGDDDLIAFSSMLGSLVVQPTGEHERPEIQTITLRPDRTNEVMRGYRRGNFLWHFDGATDATPQKGTFLSAREVDADGAGGTQFASAYLAYETLPDDKKAEIDGLEVQHSFARAQGLARPDASDEDRAMWEAVPSRVHPLVWKRADGRRSLLLGATAASVVGLPESEGRALLDELEAWATRPEVTVEHHWEQGDLVTWDNTGMLHRATPFDELSNRLLHRTTLAGEEEVVPAA